MFQWYQKNLKKYERLAFAILLTLIVLGFVFTGVNQDVFQSDKAAKDLAIATPSENWTHQQFEDLAYRWDHALMQGGKMITIFMYQHADILYPGDPRGGMMAYVMASRMGSTRELNREIATTVCLVLAAAKQADIRVTETEIADAVKNTMSFEGGMDMAKYKLVLGQMELDEEQYEKTVGEYLLADKYLQTVNLGVSVATQDVFNEFMRTGDRAKAKFVYFNDMDYRARAKSKVTQKSLVDMLRLNKDRYGYKAEAKTRLEFIRVPYAPLLEKAGDATEEELRKYYDDHKEEFAVPQVAFPPEGSKFWPSDMVEKPGHPIEHPGESDASVMNYAQIKYQVVEKVKEKKAADAAAEVVKKIRARMFDMQMQGTPRPDFVAIAKEFDLEAPGTTGWFEEEETKPIEDVLGKLKSGAGNLTGWYLFFADRVETAPVREARTETAHVLARVVEKTEGKSYLFTNHIRSKAVTDCSRDAAAKLVDKETRDLLEQFKDRYTKAEAARTSGGQTLKEEERATLHYDTFTALCAEKKLVVKETDWITRSERTIKDVADAQRFTETLFQVETKGDVKSATATSGSAYVIQLFEKRPPKPDDLMTKRKQIEDQLLRDKQGKWAAEMLAAYRDQKDAKGNPLVKISVDAKR